VENIYQNRKQSGRRSAMSDTLISVVIPVYNERATIEEILTRVQRVELTKEIIIVDDGSCDGTREFLGKIAKQAAAGGGEFRLPNLGKSLSVDNVRVFFQPKNAGKGAALRRGFTEARGQIIVIQDADLEYDPDDLYNLIEPIEHGDADVVFGSRFLGGPHRVHLFWHYVGNRLLTLLSDMVTDLNLSDVWTCYKAFKREVLQGIVIEEDRFGFEQEITIKISKNRWRVYEIPISYYGRTYTQGKKITWKDGFRALWCILRYGLTAKRPVARKPQSAPEPAISSPARTTD
jgi:glycosyltransferase involved in cell wall biosynthesis